MNTRKTRFFRKHAQQRLAGVVVNEGANVPRKDFDRLKAILTNCIRHGPASQNRDGVPDFRSHLLGRLAHVAQVHPGKAARLRGLFERIDWATSAQDPLSLLASGPEG